MMYVKLTYHITASNIRVLTELAIFTAFHTLFLRTLPVRPQIKPAVILSATFPLMCVAILVLSPYPIKDILKMAYAYAIAFRIAYYVYEEKTADFVKTWSSLVLGFFFALSLGLW